MSNILKEENFSEQELRIFEVKTQVTFVIPAQAGIQRKYYQKASGFPRKRG